MHGAGPASRLLLIERDSGVAQATASAFAACFVAMPDVSHVRGGREAADVLRAEAFDLVLADLLSLDDLGLMSEDAIARICKLGGSALTVAIAPDTSVSAAVGAMRAGAHDVLGRPLEPGTLAVRIGRLAQRHGRSFGLVVDGAEPVPANTQPSMVPSPSDRQVLPMWRQEQRIIEDAIARFAGNVALAAAALELSPSTIYRKRQAWAEADQQRRGAA